MKQHLDAKLDEMKDTIELRRSQGLEAALALVNSDRGKSEMDAIRVQLAEMATEETRVRQERLAQMASAQATALASSLLAGVLGLIMTLTIGFLIRRATLARRREEWLQAGQVGLATAMLGDQSLEQLGDSVLQFLASYTGAVAGAFFVGGGIYRRASAYGVPEGAKLPLEIKPREGLLGQAAAENRTLVVEDAPDATSPSVRHSARHAQAISPWCQQAWKARSIRSLNSDSFTRSTNAPWRFWKKRPPP